MFQLMIESRHQDGSPILKMGRSKFYRIEVAMDAADGWFNDGPDNITSVRVVGTDGYVYYQAEERFFSSEERF